MRAEVGSGVTIVAATKYVPLEEMAVLAEAGIEVVGENRAQDLEAKHAAYGDAFRWHFIGHLQSRKAKIVNGICELVHSLDSESAARQFLGLYPDVRGLATMPPETDDPESSRFLFRKLGSLAREHELTELSMGTSQDYKVAVEEGATMIRIGSVLYQS